MGDLHSIPPTFWICFVCELDSNWLCTVSHGKILYTTVNPVSYSLSCIPHFSIWYKQYFIKSAIKILWSIFAKGDTNPWPLFLNLNTLFPRSLSIPSITWEKTSPGRDKTSGTCHLARVWIPDFIAFPNLDNKSVIFGATNTLAHEIKDTWGLQPAVMWLRTIPISSRSLERNRK